jgi:hypothetical protein
MNKLAWAFFLVAWIPVISAESGCSSALSPVDPCPGELTCSDGVCCPTDTPYQCGSHCYSAPGPCGGNYIVCGGGSSGASGACASGQLECGNLCCPDATHYACNNGACQLTSCESGLQLCGSGCIPVTSNCCDQRSGLYCQTGEVCCDTGCIPIGTSCCAGGRYCPVGRVCCGNGQCC